MNEKKSITISITGLLLVVAIVIIIIMGCLLWKVSNTEDNKIDSVEHSNLNNQTEIVSNQTQTKVNVSNDNTNKYATATSSANAVSYANITGMYEYSSENTSVSLLLNEDGTFWYQYGSNHFAGYIGNYIIEENTIKLNSWFKTGGDVSAQYMINSKFELTVNSDGSITDNNNFLKNESGNSDLSNIKLIKISEKSEDNDNIINHLKNAIENNGLSVE